MNPEVIPLEMRSLNHWVNWRIEKRGDRFTKVPYNSLTGGYAKSNITETWSDFQTAFSKIAQYDGIGFQAGVEPCGIILLDLDHCIVNGEIDSWARKILSITQSYTEVSPSKDGLHVFFKGKLPGKSIGASGSQPHAEIYDRRHFFTVTGHITPEFNRPFRELSL